MNLEFILPTLVGMTVIAVIGRFEWRLHPAKLIRLLTTAMAAAAGVVSLVVLATALGFVLGPARASALVEWCRVIPLHHQVTPLAGMFSLVATTSILFRCGRILIGRWKATRSVQSDSRVEIVTSERPFAYAVPTRAGCVVISTALLASLGAVEQRAVFAHERAHLRLRHHHYLLAVALSEAVLPFLRPLGAQVRHATERAADEAAAAVVADRDVVARAITLVALSPDFSVIPALGGGSVPRRVEALLWPSREPVAGRSAALAGYAAVFTIVSTAGVQVHHLATLFDHLCHSTA